MRGLTAVFGREVAERRMLPLAALALGLVPLASVHFPGVSHENPADVRSGMAALISLGLTAVLSLLLGGSVIARDLGEKRLGFYFARPLGGWAIWGGKLAAAAVLAFGAGFLVLLPTALLNARWPDPGGLVGLAGAPGLWIAMGCVAAFLLLAGHALGIILRSRSVWLVLDFAGAFAVYLLLAFASRRLAAAGALAAWVWILTLFAGLAMIALLSAGAAQVIAGRTDPRRGHRALSLWLWSLLLAGSLGVHAYTGWELAGTPKDLSEAGDVIASRGSWIAVDGWDSGRKLWSLFLMDVASGRSQRIRSVWNGEGLGVAFAPGEGWAAWLEPPPGEMRAPLFLRTLDLQRPDSVPLESPVSYEKLPQALGLSTDGARVAAVMGGRLLAAEVATGNSIASARLPVDVEYWPFAGFAGADRIRLRGLSLEGAGAEQHSIWQTWELDLTRKQLRQLGDFGPYKQAWSPAGDRMVRFNRDRGGLEILDGWTARILAWHPWTEAPPSSLAVLSGGRVALVTAAGGGSEVRVLAPDLSAELRRIPLPGEAALFLKGQPGPDLLAAVTGPPSVRKKFRTFLLDLEAGSSRELGQDLLPVSSPMFPPEPGSAGARLFRTRERRLLQLDPRTGSLRPFLGTGDKS